MQIITKPKTLLVALMACGLSTAACAGEQTQAAEQTHDSSNVSFIKADSDEDSQLNRDEFKLFVALEAEAGMTDYAAINEAGNEDLHFSGKDIDGDGLLTKDELAYKVILNNEPAEIKSSYGSSNKKPDTTPSEDKAPDIEPTEG